MGKDSKKSKKKKKASEAEKKQQKSEDQKSPAKRPDTDHVKPTRETNPRETPKDNEDTSALPATPEEVKERQAEEPKLETRSFTGDHSVDPGNHIIGEQETGNGKKKKKEPKSFSDMVKKKANKIRKDGEDWGSVSRRAKHLLVAERNQKLKDEKEKKNH